ncbi:uncharacterized protein LAESUDRAFT_262141 [Laetiporus sulphureus 93-53]|uniref:Fe2OG dioxygenase domain-containing protein n=1 Tax=Laetiporus sulphureus 93-53 TaxID=1314785 RepID=A0A165H5J4_9APHY|nr:uncharacterized protein LAESUDRAFT_262141 [Laetiporus sulphureus 93-53]KZT11272.1 hypothetical protein LAESUDRAFT_262141 [Laetiporus sulphureus 93-53]
MASRRTRNDRNPARKISNPSQPPQFPSLQPKHGVNVHPLIEDQILFIDNILTANECRIYSTFIDGQPLELTPPKKKGEADRVNYRMSVTSPEMAQRLFDLLSPHLPNFPYPGSAKRRNGPSSRPVHSMNSNIRMYKYTPGQYFGPHYDDSVHDPQTGAKSEWTLLVYLSGVEDEVKGGETVFYTTEKGKGRQTIIAPLSRGTALLHRYAYILTYETTDSSPASVCSHGHECLLHEGSPVIEGTKYILRSDLMFKD